MVIPNALEKGRLYYYINFYDEKLAMPIVQSVFYIGDKHHDFKSVNEDNMWLFQYSESYMSHGNYFEMTKEIKMGQYNIGFWLDRNGLDDIIGIDRLIIDLQSIVKGEWTNNRNEDE